MCRWTGWLQSRYGVRFEDAEDILQETLIMLLHGFYTNHPNATDEDAERYLSTIPDPLFRTMLKARCVDFLRHSRCETEAYRKCQLEWQPPDGLALVEQQVLVEQVLEAFPENAREIARLVNEEYSWAEIAEALNLSQSAVKMRFWRGVAQVRQKWGIRCDESHGSFDNYNDRSNRTARDIEEGYDAQTTLVSDSECISIGSGELPDDAEYDGVPFRNDGGGGKPLTPSSGGCGCSAPNSRVMSEAEVRKELARNEGDMEWTQRRRPRPGTRPIPIPIPRPIPIPWPFPVPRFPNCPEGNPQCGESRVEKRRCWESECRRGLIKHRTQWQTREKRIYDCPWGTFVWCSEWKDT